MSARDVIACSLDHPSVFMGGPSERNQRKADAILAALSAAGWVVVPREATEAMTRAGANEINSWIAPAMHAADTYRAMIAAALPTPPQEARNDGR